MSKIDDIWYKREPRVVVEEKGKNGRVMKAIKRGNGKNNKISVNAK